MSNCDEARYPNRVGNFSKGLPHDDIGEVLPAAYDSLLTAVTSGDRDDFANIPLGGTAKLATPQRGLSFHLEGTDSGQLTSPPAPELAGPERAGEMVDYWIATRTAIGFPTRRLGCANCVQIVSKMEGNRVNSGGPTWTEC